VHDIFAEAFADEMRKLGAPLPLSEFTVPDVDWADRDVPAEPWTKRQEYAYRQARKLVKKDPVQMANMLHIERVRAMEEALARPQGAMGRFARDGVIDLTEQGLRDIDPYMYAQMQAGQKVQRRPEMMSTVLRPGGRVSKVDKALGAASPMGLGEWLRSILSRRRQADTAVRALMYR
jgi:hypothetical protein